MVRRSRKNWLMLLALLACGIAAYFWWEDHVESSQDGPIRLAAARYGVAPDLIKAIIWRESRFHPQVRGRAGEIGLMQLREEAAQEWADAEKIDGFVHEHCLDPQTNTLAGTFYLRKLLKRYSAADDPVPYALADYNAGRANVLKWNRGAAATNSDLFIGQITFPGTRRYVQAIVQRRPRYRLKFAAEKTASRLFSQSWDSCGPRFKSQLARNSEPVWGSEF